MNTLHPKSEYPSGDLHKECEDLMQDAIAGTLTEQASTRLAELLLQFPHLQSEFRAMESTIQDCRRYSIPALPEDVQAKLEQRIITRLEALTPRKESDKQAVHLTLIKRLPTQRLIVRSAAIAAVFVCGIVLGRWTTTSQNTASSNFSTNQDLMKLAQTNTTDYQQEELQNFLHDAHLLMLGVMAMNAECGLPHPQTLVAQRERCVELLVRAQTLRQNLRHNFRPHDEQHFAQVIMQVESALAELAATQPSSVNAITIRSIQNRTDDALCEVTTALAATKQ